MAALKVVAFLALLLGTPVAQAQSGFPDKAVRILVGYSPGSAPDMVARMMAERLSESWAKPVVVDNVTGAGGNIAAERVAKSLADGYTLLLTGNANMVINPSLYEKLGYDSLKDFAPITQLTFTPNVLVAHNDLPARTVQDVVAIAKSEQGKLNFGSSGTGTSGHLAGELLKWMARIELQHIPYRGPPYPDLMGGRLHLCFCNIASALPLAREGKLRALAVTSIKRSPTAPDLPTIAEQGYPGFDASGWFGLVAPAGTPEAVIQKVHRDSVALLQDPGFRRKFEDIGMVVIANSPAEFATVIRTELPIWAKVIKDAGLRAQ